MPDSKDKPAPIDATPVVDKPAPKPEVKAAAPAPAKPEPKPEPEPEPEQVDAVPAPGRGAQVILDGVAQTAARGGAAPDMAGNLAIKKGLEGRGEVADGTTPDGSTLTGKPAPDVVVAPPTDPAA